MFYNCVLSVIQLQMYSAFYTNVYSLLQIIGRLQGVEDYKIFILY